MIQRQTAVKNPHPNDSPRPLVRTGSPVPTSRGGKEERRTEQYAADLLELFYPIHYRGNMAVGGSMRGAPPRQGNAIKLVICSGRGSGPRMRRTDSLGRVSGSVQVEKP